MSFACGIGFANCDIFFLGLPRMPEEGEELYARSFDIQAGGGVPATMTVLARLGVPVKLATFLGGDEFSERVERALRDCGMSYTNLYAGDGYPTVISSTAVTASNRTFISYREDVPITQDIRARAAELFRGAKVMEMQLGMLDICRDVKAASPDAAVVLDTGWNDDLSVEGYRDYLKLADYYTPNRNEAMKLTGTQTPLDALHALAAYFAHPIVKLDTEGCLVMVNGRPILVPPLPGVRFVDATGAGDAFLAGLMYGLYHGRDIVDCVRYGNVTGGICVQAVGCLTGRVDERELKRLADAIEPRAL
ncbi:MAG: carbohydrate kinase family protein [Christensenellaceae bacterium]|nr:carbohydrate kinase family protein [Christensenellaceae bacterium]MEA5068726.1 carbohydrate kinase family protein [Christensenellaceae bacterium]